MVACFLCVISTLMKVVGWIVPRLLLVFCEHPTLLELASLLFLASRTQFPKGGLTVHIMKKHSDVHLTCYAMNTFENTLHFTRRTY